MAKAKAKQSTAKQTKAAKGKNGKASSKLPTLPNGYKVIGRAPNWDVDKHPVIDGVRGPTNEVKMPLKKGQKKPDIRRNCVVTDETIGPVCVWESSMLADFFNATEDGNTVRIEFLGYGEAKKGQNAPKLFACSSPDV